MPSPYDSSVPFVAVQLLVARHIQRLHTRKPLSMGLHAGEASDTSAVAWHERW